ncbi:hypothetical protein ACHZ97_14575 [Lysobacter soli]|uniref:hypothetical protein n=1 Tax=Lysobacter soli TaxID=453783 RepID=UPI0037CCBD42
MALPNPLLVPAARTALAGNAPCTPEWREFFRRLAEYMQAAGTDPAVIEQILARIDELEENENTFSILGLMSVTVLGTPQDGLMQLSLANDVQAPGNTYYYGTDSSGTKGFFQVANAVDGDGSIVKTVGGDGVVHFALDGDAAAPGPDKVYGTDGAGVKGWQVSAATDPHDEIMIRTTFGF